MSHSRQQPDLMMRHTILKHVAKFRLPANALSDRPTTVSRSWHALKSMSRLEVFCCAPYPAGLPTAGGTPWLPTIGGVQVGDGTWRRRQLVQGQVYTDVVSTMKRRAIGLSVITDHGFNWAVRQALMCAQVLSYCALPSAAPAYCRCCHLYTLHCVNENSCQATPTLLSMQCIGSGGASECVSRQV